MFSKKNFFVLSLFIIIVLILFSPQKSSAYFKQEQFYDWGPSAGKINTSVLGEETSIKGQELYQPRITPEHPLYFGKRILENLNLAITFDEKKKAELRMRFAERRLAESKLLMEKNKSDLAADSLEQYKNQIVNAAEDLKKLQKEGRDVKELAKYFEKTTAVQSTTLENISTKAPKNFEEKIKTALTASQKGMDASADALGEPAVPLDVLNRINSMRGQGILTAEQAQSLTKAQNREEARKTFEHFVKDGSVPQVDFKRFDTGQAKYFKNEFERSIETHKLNELMQRERQKPDEKTLEKIEDFSRDFKSGDTVPPELKKPWSDAIRTEELQKTIRPDKINLQEAPPFEEIKNRMRPTEDEARSSEKYLNDNPNKEIPPQIERTFRLKEKFGIVKEGFTPPPGHKETTLPPPQEEKQFKDQKIENPDFRKPYYPPQPPPSDEAPRILRP